MRSAWRRWLPAILFWSLLAACVKFSDRYPWLDFAWLTVSLLLVVAISGYSVFHLTAHYSETQSISYKPVPRWLRRFSSHKIHN
jgi:hypothetical protein